MNNNSQKSVIMLIIIVTLSSCIMDRKTTFYIKNCTKDTLLMGLSGADSFVDWQFGGKQEKGTILPNDADKIEITFHKDIIGSIALPDSTIYVDPYLYDQHDTCYIYTIKLDIAQHHSIDEICTEKLYDRQVVTKKSFHNRLFEYRTDY